MAAPVWRTKPFLVSHLAAALLLATWLWPVTGVFWDQLDVAVFRLLNNSLSLGESWQMFWALANHRNIDFFSGGLAAIVGIWWVWGEPRAIQNGRAAIFCALAIPVIILPFVMHFLLEFLFNYKRPSPSIVLDDPIRLTHLVPSIVTKDASKNGFPGDHAFVLFSVVMFYWYLAPRKFVAISLFMAAVFMLPRLFSGAHWLTDNIMGGLVPALLVSAWVLATPLGYYLMKLYLPVIDLVVALVPERLRIPDHTLR